MPLARAAESGQRLSGRKSIGLGIAVEALILCLGLAASQETTKDLPPEYGYDASNNIKGKHNTVVQSYQFYYAQEPPKPKEPSRSKVGDGIDVNNPTCGDGGEYYAYSVTEANMDQVGVPYGVYIPDTHEIMPVMLVKLANTTLAYGRVRVKGAGLLADTAVDPMNVVRTVCGSWIFSKTGYYFYELEEADGVEVRVMYYVRRRKVTEEPVYLEYPIDIDMDVLTKVARDDIDVEVYVGVVADWASRVVDIEVEQFIADRATYEDALDNSLSEGFDELDNAEEAADAYDYNYYYDQYTAPYADYYDYEPLQVAGVGDVSKPRG